MKTSMENMHTDAWEWRVEIDTKVCSLVWFFPAHWKLPVIFIQMPWSSVFKKIMVKEMWGVPENEVVLFMESDIITIFLPRARPGFENDSPSCFLNRLTNVAEDGLLSEWMKQHLTNVQNNSRLWCCWCSCFIFVYFCFCYPCLFVY